MGVPFEALLPYGIILAVCHYVQFFGAMSYANMLWYSCSALLELVCRRLNTTPITRKDQGELLTLGIGRVSQPSSSRSGVIN